MWGRDSRKFTGAARVGGPARDGVGSPGTWFMSTRSSSLALSLSNSSSSAMASDRLNCFLRALSFPSVNKGNWEGFGFSSFGIKKKQKKNPKRTPKNFLQTYRGLFTYVHTHAHVCACTRIYFHPCLGVRIAKQIRPLARCLDGPSRKEMHLQYPTSRSQDPLTIQ